MAIRVTDKDGKTIAYEAFLVDRMVDLAGIYEISEIGDDDTLMFMVRKTKKDGSVEIQAQHWSGIGKEARDKMLAIAQKWLKLNQDEGRCEPAPD